jgi:DNA polymerase-3 subunit delta
MNSPVYILCGPEKGEKKLFLDNVIKNFEKQTGGKSEVLRYHAGQDKISDILPVIKNGALFSDARIVFIEEADEIKNRDESSALAAFIVKPAADTLLFLITDEFNIDKNLEAAVSKDNKRIFWELFETQKKKWLFSFFRTAGFELADEAAELILELYENNTLDLKKECEKLLPCLPAKKVIEAEDIEEYAVHLKQETPFSFADSIAAGDFHGAGEILSKLILAREYTLSAVSAITARQLLTACRYRAYTAAGMTDEEAAAKMGIKSKKAKQIYAELKKFYTPDDMNRIFMEAEKLDYEIKSSPSELAELLLYKFIYTAVIKKGTAESGEDF